MTEQGGAIRRVMPEVDRQAANRAAIEARRARAEVKQRLRSGELSPMRALADSREAGSAPATLRVSEFLQTFPAVGEVKAARLLEELQISPRKRLGGLGVHQRERLEQFVRERVGLGVTGQPPALTVLAGPTAVGKGTVAAYVRDNYPEVRHSVSVTTRPARPGEVHTGHRRTCPTPPCKSSSPVPPTPWPCVCSTPTPRCTGSCCRTVKLSGSCSRCSSSSASSRRRVSRCAGCGATCGIRLVGQVNMPQQAQNLPELVVRMGVVLLHLQRTNARETPKDEQPGISVADRIKAIERRAGLRNCGVAGS